jgi:hypothetical protein
VKKIILCTLIIILTHQVQAEETKGSIAFTQIFYGDSGNYKTSASHPALVFNYNFSPKLNASLEWDRTWNMYDYTDEENQQNNASSIPELTVNYNNGKIAGSDINWSSSLLIKNEDSFNDNNQLYTMLQTNFDFSNYIPKSEFIEATQFSLAPLYIYGSNVQGPTGHSNTAGISLLTNWNLPANFSFTMNAYAFREWYQGSFIINNPNKSFKNSNYFMVLAYLNYSNQLIKFNEKTNLNFNFIGGFDPWISSNKNAAWDPFLVGNEMYEWLSPTVMNGSYKKTYSLFALPQLNLSYQYDKSLSFSMFMQAKYSNQVWGDTEKNWRLQPQGGFNITYNF